MSASALSLDDAATRPARAPSAPLAALALTAAFAAFLLLPRVHDNPRLVAAFGGVAAALLGWTVLLWTSRAQRSRGFRVERAPILKSHYIQSSLQLCIYVYWGWHWREVYGEAPLILSQLVFLYAVDALLSWTRGRPWKWGFGPVPIVLSTNVFIWFVDDWYALQFLLVLTGALGKEFIRWTRDGRKVHIFNPSAFPLCVASILLILTDTTHLTRGVEIASTLFRPPYIYLEIFVLGMIVQYFFAVTLVTLSTAAVLVLLNVVYTQATGVYFFLDTNISAAVFLGFHLLVTDPKTSPRSNGGKVVFGVLYGLSIAALYLLLGKLDAPQFYDKLLPIPLLNLCVRRIDRLAEGGWLGRFTRWEARFDPRRLNLAHMGAWAALFSGLYATGFVEAPHPARSIAFWKQAYEEGRFMAGEKMLQMIVTRVDKDSGVACNALGTLYVEGELVPKSDALAGYWFGRACELGSTRGCLNLARQHVYAGQAVDPAALQAAMDALDAECGLVEGGAACAVMGSAYEHGQGRPLDIARALERYAQGCAAGDVEACKGLARLRLPGQDGPGDLAAAAVVLEQACAAGDAAACLRLARLAYDGNGVPHDESRARALLAQGCALGSMECCSALQSIGPGPPSTGAAPPASGAGPPPSGAAPPSSGAGSPPVP